MVILYKRCRLKISWILATCIVPFALALAGSGPSSGKIAGKFLEGCSCMVPCPCTFGRFPHPLKTCESLAFFQFESGEFGGVRLDGLRFVVAALDGGQGIIYLDSNMSAGQRSAVGRIAAWILSLEKTPVAGVRTAPVALDMGGRRLRGWIEGTDTRLIASPLVGNDGKPGITVSKPWIFGSFPVTSARKDVADALRVRDPSLSFEYSDTNANDGVFEFLPTDVR